MILCFVNVNVFHLIPQISCQMNSKLFVQANREKKVFGRLSPALAKTYFCGFSTFFRQYLMAPAEPFTFVTNPTISDNLLL